VHSDDGKLVPSADTNEPPDLALRVLDMLRRGQLTQEQSRSLAGILLEAGLLGPSDTPLQPED
jgi:hypothetical protein